MDFNELKTLEEDAVMQTYGRFDLGFKKGEGAILYDFEDQPYVDLTSGIGVNALGHNHPALVSALQNQVATLMETSNLYYTQPMVDAAVKLKKLSGMDKIFFGNSGAEANEGMIKLARKYSYDKYGEGRNKVLTLKNSFHGRTVMTLEATGQDHFHQYFFPFTNAFDYVEANNLQDLYDHYDETVCAVMVELIQGEGGVLPLDKEFVQGVQEFCHEHDLLFLIDEVQTGMGRTGAVFCYQNYGLSPDVVSLAKGLGGGVPIGAIMANEKTSSVLQKGDHGSTFGGNPLATCAANVVLDTISQTEFLEEVQKKGAYLKDALSKIDSPLIHEVRGMGLMIGVIVDPETLMPLIQKLMDHHVLALKAGKSTIRLLPPLTITYENLDQAIQAFQEVFA
jgi:acetylornithine/N-succinyldiaminopimelate aminotransferase